MAKRQEVRRAARSVAVLAVVVGTVMTVDSPSRAIATQATTTTAPPTTSRLPASPVPGAVTPTVAVAGSAPVTTAPVAELPAPPDGGIEEVRTNAIPLVVDGPEVSAATEQAASFVFTGTAGQTIAVSSSRPWRLQDPDGTTIAENESTVALQSSGRYLVIVGPGLRPPVTAHVRTVDPTAIVTRTGAGQPFTFTAAGVGQQYARIPVRGGQRYRLSLPGAQEGVRLCANDWTSTNERSIGCVAGISADDRKGRPQTADGDPGLTFVLTRDQDVIVTGAFPGTDPPATLTGRIDEVANDQVIDTSKVQLVDKAPGVWQRIVIPFWGSPAERAVLSSPTSANVEPWGQPWIDREEDASGRVKVFATPVVFASTKLPFVAWSGGERTDEKPNQQRFGVYRGEDTAATVPATGEAFTIRNRAWFAAVGSLTLEAGARYALQVTGTSIRPISLAVRDPSGKFTSNLSPWQWTEDNSEQRAITTLTADKAGRWAVELRPAGNAVRDLKVSLLKVGAGGSYKGSVDVDDVLSVGDKTDVQLGPNEFARLTVKLTNATPQIIQPEVLRYRNTTFQPTAVDMSLWDSKGRLVWSNNRNLEEEVLSGRLGQEPQLSERFATVASSEAYTLIVDPHTDIAGRFRVAVTSTPVFSDVRLGDGAIPLLLGGTRTGVVETATPKRYRLSGASACVTVTSNAELSRGGSLPCVRDGATISLPAGVHRLSFAKELTAPATFTAVAASEPPDPIPTFDVALDGPVLTLPKGDGDAVVRIAVPTAGTRIVLQSGDNLERGVLVRPDGTRTDTDGVFVAAAAGTYQLLTSLQPGAATVIQARRAPAEVQPTALVIGAKSKIVALRWGQRLEATIVVPARAGIALDLFEEHGSVRLLYIAGATEQRVRGGGTGDGFILPKGTYRFVFVGNGDARLALRKLKLSAVYEVYFG